MLDHTVEKYNNTYHNTIKMKPIDVKYNTIQYNIDPDVKDPKFSIGGLCKNLKLQKRFC